MKNSTSFLTYSLIFIAIIATFFSSNFLFAQQRNSSEDKILIPIESLKIEESQDIFFGHITDIAIGKTGEIYMYDRDIPALYAYDKDGTFIKTIGGEGRGPGEFIEVAGLYVLPNNKLAVYDPRNARVNFYNTTGEFEAQVLVKGGLYTEQMFEIGSDGSFFINGNILRKSTVQQYWVKQTLSGAPIDTLYYPEIPLIANCWVNDGSSGIEDTYCERRISWLTTDGSVVTGNNRDYSFEIWRTNDTILVSRDLNNVEFNDKEYAFWSNRVKRMAAQGLPINDNLPEHKPAFKQIISDSNGRIWVKKYVAAEYSKAPFYGSEGGWWEPPTFDIFLPNGIYYGTVTFPHGFNFKDANGDEAYGVLTNNELEQSLVRYTLTEL